MLTGVISDSAPKSVAKQPHTAIIKAMKHINRFLDACRDAVRWVMQHIAVFLNKLTGGRLTPNTVTIIGLFAHIPIAWLIATAHPLKAAALLVIFGLFDSLDGTLARLQKRASNGGMLLDASTDRMKEAMLYTGVAAYFVNFSNPTYAIWAAAACGASLCVSYVKAKGETAVAKSSSLLSASEINRLFQDGFLRFEIRMALLVIGLLTGYLQYAIVAIAIFSAITATGRLIRIMRHLDAQS